MAQRTPVDVAGLLNRAETESPKAKMKLTPQVSAEPAARRIYSGDPQATTPGYAVRPAKTKPAARKRRSTFNVVTFLFCLAIAIVLYISNILAVNQLVVDVNQLHARYNSVLNRNSLLRAELSKKTTRDRIVQIAEKELGLVSKGTMQGSFDVEQDKLEKFKEK
jgi:cell division protein FtsB